MSNLDPATIFYAHTGLDPARAVADWTAFDRLMARPGGQPPRDGDELPVDLAGRYGIDPVGAAKPQG